ncbi:hypothetical protein DL93DRAFT_2206593 [Clavulina sp. PMI_390]|nr:hypothetical protein DL93DRAFT_2206593 [Clavulina sp. PMI_390]
MSFDKLTASNHASLSTGKNYYFTVSPPDTTDAKGAREWAIARLVGVSTIKRAFSPEIRSAFADSKYDQDPKALLDAIKTTYGAGCSRMEEELRKKPSGTNTYLQNTEQANKFYNTGDFTGRHIAIMGLLQIHQTPGASPLLQWASWGSSYTLDDFLKEIHMQFAQNEGLSDVSAGAAVAAAAAAASLAQEASGSHKCLR